MTVSREEILRLVASPDYRPMRRSELARALRAEPDERADLRRILRDLVQEGELAIVRHNRYLRARDADLVAGRIQIAERGFGFLTPDHGGAELYIAADHTSTAMHGDHVLVRTIERPRRKPGITDAKQEGQVVRILERAHRTMVGTLRRSRHFHYVIPDDPRIIHDIYVPAPKPPLEAAPGAKVVVRMLPWENRHVSPEGEIVEVLGSAMDPGVDILSIVRRLGLPRSFPERVKDAARSAPGSLSAADREGRLDLRSCTIFTIDPEDARDHDDAVSLEPADDNGWKLGVHIADVGAYVQEGTDLDCEARERATSVYLADRVLPMLPEEFSAGICSLREGEERLAQTVFAWFDAASRLTRYEIHPSVIRSKCRTTYAEVQSVLDGRREGNAAGLAEPLNAMAELAGKLRARRLKRGALDLDMPEARVVVDDAGRPADIRVEESDPAHRLIEEFMILANEIVARHLVNAKYPAVFRVHEPPFEDRLQEFAEFARSLGLRVGDPSRREELRSVIDQARRTAHEHLIKMALLRSMNRAVYRAKPLGHFGLAARLYLHFTSPIRRYPDLVVHRILERCRRGEPPGHTPESLEEIARHASQREQKADEAERESQELMKLKFVMRQIDEHTIEVYDAIVTGVRSFGLFVELPQLQVSGMVHIGQLGGDFYRYSRSRGALVGRTSRRRFAVGDRLRVLPYRVDPHKRQYDFALARD
jgi:ribonuclease R